jgi:hypothetical protein
MHSMAAEEVVEMERNDVDLLRHGATVVAAATVVDADHQSWQSLVYPGVGPWDVLLDGVDPTRYYSLHHHRPSSC